jgi:hypothetical protein
VKDQSLAALAASIAVHIALISGIATSALFSKTSTLDPFEALHIAVIPPPQEEQTTPEEAPAAQAPDVQPGIFVEKVPASLDAPPAPTEEEWKLASTYTLKNSKRYRYTWAQQVRSMMGTAIEGPDQGVVRFAIEIAPNGKVVRVDTIWSTSDKAETLARAAIAALPPLPPTPTGEPLIFEKTISFQPFEAGWPPMYKYDCLPDPPRFNNPWVWDGKSARAQSVAETQSSSGKKKSKPSECPDILPDTLEAEAADMQRQFDMWESSRLNSPKQRP